MKFKQAEVKLANLYPNKYRFLNYEKTTTSDGKVKTLCNLYIDGFPTIFRGPTWVEAFKSLEETTHPENIPIEETPDE